MPLKISLATFLIFTLACSLYCTNAAAQIYFDTDVDSRLWLEGSSTVHRFDCVARSIQGTAFIDGFSDPYPLQAGGSTPKDTLTTTAREDRENSGNRQIRPSPGEESEEPRLHVSIKIPITSFDCRHSRMNRDMYQALKSDRYDYITFDFQRAHPLEPQPHLPDTLFADAYHPFFIEGILNVAGVERQVSLIIQGRRETDGRYNIRGRKEISMPDYDIDPPTAFRGLIRAHEDLTVFFDLMVLEKSSDP